MTRRRVIEAELHRWVQQVRDGALPRRDFMVRLAALGVTAPMAGLMLMHAGVAQAQPAFVYKPTKRGGGGPLKLLMWQGPTLLNPHFATGTKDEYGSRIFYEPLARWDAEGNLLPVLAAEIPSRANGGLAADGKSVVWKLKKGVTWHDGKAFTADDVVFNYEYATDPATAAVTAGAYEDVTVQKIDSHTVRVVFAKPAPFWPGIYSTVQLIPRHLFANYGGAKSREAPNNLKPVGTGPYKFVDFKPGDLLRGEHNANYHMPLRPHFDTVEMGQVAQGLAVGVGAEAERGRPPTGQGAVGVQPRPLQRGPGRPRGKSPQHDGLGAVDPGHAPGADQVDAQGGMGGHGLLPHGGQELPHRAGRDGDQVVGVDLAPDTGGDQRGDRAGPRLGHHDAVHATPTELGRGGPPLRQRRVLHRRARHRGPGRRCRRQRLP